METRTPPVWVSQWVEVPLGPTLPEDGDAAKLGPATVRTNRIAAAEATAIEAAVRREFGRRIRRLNICSAPSPSARPGRAASAHAGRAFAGQMYPRFAGSKPGPGDAFALVAEPRRSLPGLG